MPRFATPVTSAAALAAGGAIAAIVPGATTAFRLRRITGGTVAGTSAVSDQQLLIGINRATARGTQTTTLTPGKLDPRSTGPGITGVDTAWSVQPTLAAQDLWTIPLNAKSGFDFPWEVIEEMFSDVGTANPLVLVNRTNALPTATSYAITIEHEE